VKEKTPPFLKISVYGKVEKGVKEFPTKSTSLDAFMDELF
jgi:hypothetical protein